MRSSSRPVRILIVDDEEALLQSLIKAVRARGYEAVGVSDGRQALEHIREHSPDLIVTDLRMPGLDGPALMGKLDEEGLSSRVMVITGYATIEAAVDCLRKGALDFLVKPFELEDFLRSVERALSRPRSSTAGEPDWDVLRERYGLTRRETEILRAVYASGKSNRELAEEFCIGAETVKSHLKVALRKLGASNRTHMLRLLQEFR